MRECVMVVDIDGLSCSNKKRKNVKRNVHVMYFISCSFRSLSFEHNIGLVDRCDIFRVSLDALVIILGSRLEFYFVIFAWVICLVCSLVNIKYNPAH